GEWHADGLLELHGDERAEPDATAAEPAEDHLHVELRPGAERHRDADDTGDLHRTVGPGDELCHGELLDGHDVGEPAADAGVHHHAGDQHPVGAERGGDQELPGDGAGGCEHHLHDHGHQLGQLACA